MKKLILILLLTAFISIPVRAMEITAPEAPDSALEYMPADQGSFGEGLWFVVKSAIGKLQPNLAQAGKTCLAVVACVMLTSLIGSFPGITKNVTELTTAVAVGCLILGSANSLIGIAVESIRELRDYGKLLLPVMTTAMAAQGGITASAALYTGTAIFDAVLSSLIASVLVPLVYIYVALAVANSALGQQTLKQLQDFIKWLVTWGLKTALYIFTGYMAVTGAVSGTADQAALKATKLTISGMVPVVGGILSDASEAVLVGAGVVKSTAGIYGMLAVLSIAIGPFLHIGIHYLLLKMTAGISGIFASKKSMTLLQDFSCAMGLLLAMTGTVCLMLLISTVCFLKGVG